MKKLLFLILSVLVLSACGGNNEPVQLSFDEIQDLALDEQVKAIIDNAGLVEDYRIVLDGNSVAVVYPAEYISDNRLALDDSGESFPNVAMTLVEHLNILDLDEIVITSYEPSTDLTKVSALFTNETIRELDFDKWKDEKEKFPQRIYRYSDGYLIRGNVWENLNEDEQEAIGNESKNVINSDSQFWEYYGSYVE
ncbi:membrane lipoprotein lipid attachment site-containing protein [Halalkalibacterium halodurans]|uniref:membrane lipoprotein lipid attachment site-containing protein n=1 Tax=Halalkalibacterium halodurans TaxID=86665 RepID=UPI002E1F0529|nr:membrane lipoprotein lipid attachment site-containing protein [Halalkalibacterium halodurans]